MAERKVLVKYYHPEFDAEKLPRYHLKRSEQNVVVRMMLPFTVQCKSCGEFIYRGKKFNTKIEEVKEEVYLTIKVYRFYFKCTNCNCECTFKTDPRNSDYSCEYGITRNHEPWRETKQNHDDAVKAKEEEEKDVMKLLENRTDANRKEIEDLDHLEEIKDRKERLAFLNPDVVIESHISKADILKKQEEEDNETAKLVFANRILKRLDDDEDLDEEGEGAIWDSIIYTNDLLRSVLIADPTEGEDDTPKEIIKPTNPAPIVEIKSNLKIKSKADGSVKIIPANNKKAKITNVTISNVTPKVNALSSLADYSDDDY